MYTSGRFDSGCDGMHFSETALYQVLTDRLARRSISMAMVFHLSLPRIGLTAGDDGGRSFIDAGRGRHPLMGSAGGVRPYTDLLFLYPLFSSSMALARISASAFGPSFSSLTSLSVSLVFSPDPRQLT